MAAGAQKTVDETPGLGLMKRGCLGIGCAVGRKLTRKVSVSPL